MIGHRLRSFGDFASSGEESPRDLQTDGSGQLHHGRGEEVREDLGRGVHTTPPTGRRAVDGDPLLGHQASSKGPTGAD
eukprot:9904686-Heterocapsa_arctica.AAC.1